MAVWLPLPIAPIESMMNSNLDAPLVVWPCYEPSGLNMKLCEQDLSHVLLIGSTGSGKTTLLTSAIGQLIVHQANSPADKIGLLVLDAKAEELATRVRESAEVSGRIDDLVLLGPGGNHALDLFGGLRTLEDVERIARAVMAGTEQFGGDNTYWWQSSVAMLHAAFALLVASREPITFASTVEFLRRWFLSPETPRPLLELVQRLNLQGGSRHPLLATALDQVLLWQQLDPRTRTNLQSCLINILRPLLSTAAARCFCSTAQKSFDPAQVATSGRLCVVSVNAMAEPELARFMFRLAKQQFFDAVQQRRTSGRLCGLIADEFPLMVNREDLDTIATIRSKRGFILAGTQSVQSIEQRIGTGAARAMIANFNTLIFMRTREAEAAVLAFVAMGTRREKHKRRSKDEPTWLGVTKEPEQSQLVEIPICPVGALGQLAPHQAYIAFADGRRTDTPVWFAPWFEMTQSEQPQEAVTVDSYFTASHVESLMARHGRPRMWSTELISAAIKLSRRRNRKILLKKVESFFLAHAVMVPKGLESLPTPWLEALPRILWSTRRPEWTKLPYFIDGVFMENGVLLLHFAQEQPNLDQKFTAWDRLRVVVNAGLYPSAFRELKPQHQKLLAVKFPELRLKPEDPDQGLI